MTKNSKVKQNAFSTSKFERIFRGNDVEINDANATGFDVRSEEIRDDLDDFFATTTRIEEGKFTKRRERISATFQRTNTRRDRRSDPNVVGKTSTSSRFDDAKRYKTDETKRFFLTFVRLSVAPIFKVFAELLIPNVTIRPSAEETQLSINKSVQAIISISKSIYQWNQDGRRVTMPNVSSSSTFFEFCFRI